MPEKATFVIDGARFETLDGFFVAFEQAVLHGAKFGHNYNALADVLFGGMGTPKEGFRLIWKNASVSEARLGYAEIARLAAHGLQYCHTEEARQQLQAEMERARRHEGPTIFDDLVSIFEAHQIDGVELILEN